MQINQRENIVQVLYNLLVVVELAVKLNLLLLAYLCEDWEVQIFLDVEVITVLIGIFVLGLPQ